MKDVHESKEKILCPKHEKEEIGHYDQKSSHYSIFACGCICNKDGSWEVDIEMLEQIKKELAEK